MEIAEEWIKTFLAMLKDEKKNGDLDFGEIGDTLEILIQWCDDSDNHIKNPLRHVVGETHSVDELKQYTNEPGLHPNTFAMETWFFGRFQNGGGSNVGGHVLTG